LLLFLVLDLEGSADLDGDVLDCVHCLVGEGGLQRISGVEAGELADEAVDAVGLDELLAVDLEHGNATEGRARLQRGPVPELDAIVLERDAADVERETGDLAAAAVD